MNFEMQIIEVFHFQSGETVFAGSVTGRNELIKQCKAELIIDGTVDKTIEIRGEFLGVRHPEGHRALSTFEPIELTSEFVKKHDCTLRSIQ